MLIRILLAGLFLLVPGTTFAAPEVGQPAPDFKFEGVGSATYRLADYVGSDAGSKVGPEQKPSAGDKRGVVIAWFPKAFTSG